MPSFPPAARPVLLSRLAWCLPAWCLLLPLACADDEQPAAPDAGPPTQGPYLGSLRVAGPANSFASYTAVVPAVDQATNTRLRMGLETPSAVRPSAYAGVVFIPGGSNPVITKYAPAGEGFQALGTISFAGQGASFVGNAPQVGVDMVAPDKAYLFVSSTMQIVVWNPQTMTLTGKTIDLSSVLQEGIPAGWNAQVFLDNGSGFARQRGNRLFVPISWRNWNAPNVFFASAGLLVIDTDNDTVVSLLRDPRLADSIYTVLHPSGDLYLFTGALGVSHHRVLGHGTPGGVLRVPNGQEAFDPAFYIDLNQVVGNRPASTPIWAGGTSVYLKAYHEEQQPITAEVIAAPNTLIRQQAWRYWKVDLAGVEPPREMTELPWTSTDGFFYQIPEENRLFLGVMAADLASTTLYEATAAGFVKTIDVTGVLTTLGRLDRTR